MIPLPSQRACAVPGCPDTNCHLRTHQLYQTNTTERALAYRRRRASLDIALRQIERYGSEIPSEDGVDGFPALPLEEGLDPEVRSLFHFFFTTIFDKLALLFRGPSMTNMGPFKERMLKTALTSKSYCYSLILQARTQQDIAMKRHEETKAGLDLMNKTMQSFREQLAIIHQRPHPLQIELALLVLCVLMMYDVAYGRSESQLVHWRGMQDLVALRGGMYCVTTALAYVIHADRACAIRHNMLPTYTSHSVPLSLPSPIPDLSLMRPESRFYRLREQPLSINPSVIKYLVDISGLVQVWDDYKHQALSERRRRPSISASSGYLTYMRDQVDERFAVLNAQWSLADTPERSLLLASRIIEYPCTWSNYAQSMTSHLHGKLAATLQEQQKRKDPVEEWHSDLSVLTWMLFALTTVDPGSEIYYWAIQNLQRTFDAKYGSQNWAPTWRVDEQENLLNLIWSNPLFAVHFERVCDDLENIAGQESNTQRLSLDHSP